jgi:tRNA 2-thiouridine synthesizing protein A
MTTPDALSEITPDRQVDARGTACPGPLLEAMRLITTVPVGGVMEVLSTDPSTNRDLPKWAGKVGHEHLGTIKEPAYWRIFVKRGK